MSLYTFDVEIPPKPAKPWTESDALDAIIDSTFEDSGYLTLDPDVVLDVHDITHIGANTRRLFIHDRCFVLTLVEVPS